MELTIVIGCQRAIEKQALPQIMMPLWFKFKGIEQLLCKYSDIIFH
jgi:hypothetical protein